MIEPATFMFLPVWFFFLSLTVFSVDQVTLDMANEAFEVHGLLSPNLTWESNIEVGEAQAVLTMAFQSAEGRQSGRRLDIMQCTDLALNWLLNTYDRYCMMTAELFKIDFR